MHQKNYFYTHPTSPVGWVLTAALAAGKVGGHTLPSPHTLPLDTLSPPDTPYLLVTPTPTRRDMTPGNWRYLNPTSTPPPPLMNRMTDTRL